MCTQSEHRRLPVGTVLCAVGWLLSLALGCELTQADEVDRTPTIGRGSGGSGGHDAPVFADVALPSQSDRYDAVLDLGGTESRAAIDGTTSLIDSIQTADASQACIEEGLAFCDDFGGGAQSDGSVR